MLPGDGTEAGPAHPPPKEDAGILVGDPEGCWGAALGVPLMHQPTMNMGTEGCWWYPGGGAGGAGGVPQPH